MKRLLILHALFALLICLAHANIKADANKIYNVFSLRDWQEIASLDSLYMGDMNAQKIQKLSIHEFGHSFVKPVVAQLPDSSVSNSVELLGSEHYDTPESYKTLIAASIEEWQFLYLPLILQELRNANESKQPFETGVKNTMQEFSKLAQVKKSVACELNWHTEDVTRFWEVYDQSKGNFKGRVWQETYIDNGSAGLHAFVPNRIESGKKMAKILKKEQAYYKAVRAGTTNLAKEKEAVCAIYSQLGALYPKAQFPDIYFVIGRRNTGGTVFNGGIVIGIERFGTPTEHFTPDLDVKDLHALIAHELIHFQQNYVRDNSLLAQSVREGAGDFLGELLTGYKIETENYRYGNAREAELKAEFIARMHANDWSGWLYYNKDKSRPKDLGYWMGYQICKNFYDQQADKKQAVHEILNINNFKAFLESSRYLSAE